MEPIQWVNLGIALALLALAVTAIRLSHEPKVRVLLIVILTMSVVGVLASAGANPIGGVDVYRLANAALRTIALITLAGFVLHLWETR